MISVELSDPAQVGEARRRADGLAERVGLDDAARSRLALAITEAATNIVRHVGSGEIVVSAEGGPGTVFFLALDRGRGIADVPRAMADGFSTGGGQGTGLGAIRRQSDLFELHAVAGQGTALLAAFGHTPEGTAGAGPSFTTGAVCLPRRGGGVENGDRWWVRERPDGLDLFLCDALGHGPAAAQVADLAEWTFRARDEPDMEQAMHGLHGALQGTRGAAVALAAFRPRARSVDFVGVGNIAGRLIGGGRAHGTVSMNGIVGHGPLRTKRFAYDLADGTLAVFHSDGLRPRWSLDAYPGLAARHPALIAGVLYRDFRRTNDDCMVVALRDRSP